MGRSGPENEFSRMTMHIQRPHLESEDMQGESEDITSSHLGEKSSNSPPRTSATTSSEKISDSRSVSD